jgi:hypothetical protein
MLRRWLFVAVRSILVGWAALLALTYVVERPLILWTAPLLGDHWVATAKLSLDCLTLAATGWLVGRLNRSVSRAAPIFGALAFAATLALCANLNPSFGINFELLIQLAVEALHDSRYLSPLATFAAQHIFLFGSLMVGAWLSRPSPPPLSLFREDLR